jgi:hypothetical protein
MFHSVQAGFPIRVRSVELFGFVDKHDGDVIPDFIEEPAAVTDEAVSRFVETKVALALRAGENLQKILAERHLILPPQ